MKKTLAFITVLLFLLLCWFSWSWYKDTVACCDELEEDVVAMKYGPLIFNCDTQEVITNDLWPDKRAEIISNAKSNKKLLITAPYFEGESEQVGIDRAKKVGSLFTPDLSADNIVYASLSGGDCETNKSVMMHETKFNWVTRNDDIIQHLDKTLVFYEFDSDQEIKNQNVLDYFNELAEFLKSTGDTAVITGHTDSDGTDEYNMELGMKRAKEFESHLLNLGVEEEQIEVTSKGKSMPLADNMTPEGKQTNRRVEIEIKESTN